MSVDKKQFVLIARLRNFSSHSSSINSIPPDCIEFTKPSGDCWYTDEKLFQPYLYGNGNCIDTKGYVSTMFCGLFGLSDIVDKFSYLEFSSTVSVWDVAGNKRFLQTCAYINDADSSEWEKGDTNTDFPEFGLGRYVKRETLLNDPTELLPCDCLTIHIEIELVMRYAVFDSPSIEGKDTYTFNENELYFHLDSDFVKKLCKVSDYFQRVSDAPMIEKDTRLVNIPSEELPAFYLISHILDQAKKIKVNAIADIRKLYTVADKYCMQAIIEVCRQWIKSFLSGISDPNVREHVGEKISMVLELSETYRDRGLRKIVEVYLKLKNVFEKNALEEELKDKLNTEWKCVYYGVRTHSVFRLIKMETGSTELEFYK